MRGLVLVVLFGFAVGVFALITMSLVEDRSVRIAGRVVVVVMVIPFAWFAFLLSAGFDPS